MFQSRPHAVEEAHQRARALGKLEAVEQFVLRQRRVPADQMAHVQLGHLVVGQIDGLQAVALSLRIRRTVSSRSCTSTPTNTCASFESAMR